MKVLVISYSGVCGTANEVKERMRKLEKSLKKKSMGRVAKKLFQSVFGESKNVEAPDNPKENWLSVKHSIEMKKEDVEVLEQALSSIIEERNNLIHNNAAKHDLKTIVGCRKFADELEAQNGRIKSMHSTLMGFVKSNLEARKTMAEFMETEEFWNLVQGVETEEKEETPTN
jgi:hypothetical protein